MRVLIASQYLGGLTGSETFWYTVADHLIRLGADVYLHASVWGRRTGELMSLGCRWGTWGEVAVQKDVDVALVSHGPVAESVRKALPGVPMFFFCHGVLPELERPPGESVKIRRYYAVSLEVAAFLQDQGVDGEKIHGPFQPVDSERFSFYEPVRDGRPQVLVVSNRMPPEMVNVVRAACKMVNADVSFIGEKFCVKGQDEIAEMMRAAHVVVSLGRGVIEGMMSGAAPVVFDYQGCDGAVGPANVSILGACNFSGRATRQHVGSGPLAVELGFAMRVDVRKLRREAVQRYDAADLVGQLWRAIEEEV